jgi:repressor LexA
MAFSVPLTKRQHQLLSFLKSYFAEHGYMPTTTEICSHMGLAGRGGAVRLLGDLEAKKYIQRTRYKGRAIRLLQQPAVVLP